MGRLVVAATMTFDMITELIYNMTIHITTYDTCVYVDNSVDFVDYLSFFIKKRQMDQKWCIIAKECMWTNHKSSTEPVNEKVLVVQSMKFRQHEIKAERHGDQYVGI